MGWEVFFFAPPPQKKKHLNFRDWDDWDDFHSKFKGLFVRDLEFVQSLGHFGPSEIYHIMNIMKKFQFQHKMQLTVLVPQKFSTMYGIFTYIHWTYSNLEDKHFHPWGIYGSDFPAYCPRSPLKGIPTVPERSVAPLSSSLFRRGNAEALGELGIFQGEGLPVFFWGGLF